MTGLLVTNDFPPKIGGIQSYLHELWRRLPAADATVFTTHHDGEPARGEYGIGAQILADLELTTIRVLSDTPREIAGLEGFNLRITQHVPLG